MAGVLVEVGWRGVGLVVAVGITAGVDEAAIVGT